MRRTGTGATPWGAGLMVAALMAGAAQAQPQDWRFPALYDVAGVSAGDALNVRSAPSVDAEVVATLPGDRRYVEVLGLSDNGDWAQVGLGERGGWAALRYLEAQPARPDDRVPAPMRCFGTEPFWGVNFPGDGSAEYERLPQPESRMMVTLEQPPEGILGELAIGMSGDTASATAFLRREVCGDGMSDRPYGLSLRLLLRDGDGSATAHVGCCSLTGP